MEKYRIPRRLDDPEKIGLWTLDEFVVMLMPFMWGVLDGQVLMGLGLALGAWICLRKAKGSRSVNSLICSLYWYLPGDFFGLKLSPPSHLRVMGG